MKPELTEKKVSEYLKILGAAFRIQILYSIGHGEACVCHLETVLEKRQAYISQHLMVMRDAGILETRRDGKYIYYRVADRSLFDILQSVARILNIPKDKVPEIAGLKKHSQCDCPRCLPDMITVKE